MSDTDMEIPKILPPTDDHIFKTLLTHPNAGPVLTDVISATIERKVISAQVRNNEIPISDVNEKRERLDVNCVIDGGDQINVEMQASRMEERFDDHKNVKNKFVYYMTRLHSTQKSKGLAYYDFVKTYQVAFCAYTIFPKRHDFVCRSTLRTQEGELVSDQLNMIWVELNKLSEILKKPTDRMAPLEMWSLFLRYASDPKREDVINDIINKKEEIAMAATLLKEISKDEHERAKFMSRMKYETDLQSNLITAERRGKAKGEANKLTEVVRSMSAEGLSFDLIAKIAHISLDEVNVILNDVEKSIGGH